MSRLQGAPHRHRQRRRLLLAVLVLLVLAALLTGCGWGGLAALLGWVAHEAWFADHLFYRPDQNYGYRFPPEVRSLPARLQADGLLQLTGPLAVTEETLLLAIRVRATLFGRFFDPQVRIGDDRQDFERGAHGLRYLNLSGQQVALMAGHLRLRGRFCRLAPQATLYAMANPDYHQSRLLVLAAHADDAELAAFGLYSQAPDVTLVTLTRGEVEAGFFRRLGLSGAAAARLKGRLRGWDSQAIPLWGGVPQSRCLQLGYFCLQLSAMAAEPDRPFGSRESGEHDIRPLRAHNPLPLPGDRDGQPTWHNLVADLRAVLVHYRPDVVVMPHPELDPHSDHQAASRALLEACQGLAQPPEQLLLYANHLQDNDRWPMGPAGGGSALPPVLAALPADRLWSPLLSGAQQLDKAMALAMQHDLQTPLPFRKRLRRILQWLLAGRRWPRTGEDEFFRRAVRRHELFWVRPLDRRPPGP